VLVDVIAPGTATGPMHEQRVLAGRGGDGDLSFALGGVTLAVSAVMVGIHRALRG
jgi:hypothetical protein